MAATAGGGGGGGGSEAASPAAADPPAVDTARLAKRASVVQEIMSTERDYASDLDLLVEVFQKPLSSIIEPSDLQTIFPNIGQLQMVHRELLNEFDSQRGRYSDLADVRIGEIFCKLVRLCGLATRLLVSIFFFFPR
jgi:hypothetical protein